MPEASVPLTIDISALAREFYIAYTRTGEFFAPPSARFPDWNLDAAYEVEAEFARLRVAQGAHPAGRKVGFASAAAWRAHKIETVVWAGIYSDTILHSTGIHPAGEAGSTFALGPWPSIKIEPEIVFKLNRPLDASASAAQALAAVEWLAPGFEIIDNPFAASLTPASFTPSDLVAVYGLHRALFVGAPCPVDSAAIPALVEALAKFRVRLSRNDEPIAEGGGQNCLLSPALCLAELATATQRQAPVQPLRAGEIITTGCLTPQAQPISPGETWSAIFDGLPVPALRLRFT